MTVPQISVRLTPATKNQFETYASELGLDASELAKLLIMRERHLLRLARLHRDGLIPPKRRQTKKGERLPKITAHLSSISDVEAFDAYARSCNLNRNDAGAWLFERELDERWLEDAIRS